MVKIIQILCHVIDSAPKQSKLQTLASAHKFCYQIELLFINFDAVTPDRTTFGIGQAGPHRRTIEY